MTHAVNLSYFDVLNPLIYPFGRSIGLFTTLKLEIQYGWILRNRMVDSGLVDTKFPVIYMQIARTYVPSGFPGIPPDSLTFLSSG